MRNAETVTFGGSSLDRAAHLRGDAVQIAALFAKGAVLALWRGKVLVAEEGGVVWLSADSPVLALSKPAIFLGLDAGRACFAADISAWQTDTVIEGSSFDPAGQRHRT